MIRMLVRAGVFLASAAIGLWVASLVIDGVEVQAQGFIITAAVYAVVQSVLSPFIAKYTARNARAFLGGVGIVSAFLALLAAGLIGNALTITGLGNWLLAAFVVWIATALATLLLPLALVKAGVEQARERRNDDGPLTR